VAELLVTFTEPTRSAIGDLYYPRAFGRVGSDGLWEGWIEFTRAGDDAIVTTSRETLQPNRTDVMYWAQGLTQTYLEGALERALKPTPALQPASQDRVFVNSTPRAINLGVGALSPRVVLDPFLTYVEGENLLRNQLHALSPDHLHNIIEAYRFGDGDEPNWAQTAPKDALVERIVDRVRARYAAAGTSRTITPEVSAEDQARE
jgi:hypothetical protein